MHHGASLILCMHVLQLASIGCVNMSSLHERIVKMGVSFLGGILFPST